MLGSKPTSCENKVICKHDEELSQCDTKAKEANIARNLMKRLTIEIKYMILERTPLPWLADVINHNDTKYLEKIKKACKDNVVHVEPDNDSSWIVEFRKFISSMKNVPDCTQCSERFRKGNFELSCSMIDCRATYTSHGEHERNFREACLEVDFTFLKSEHRLPNQGIILDNSFTHPCGPQLFCKLRLTNRSSILSQRIRQPEEFETTKNYIRLRYPSLFVLDDNGSIYYYDVNKHNRRLKIYRKDLYANNSTPEYVGTVFDGRADPFVVGNDVLFFIQETSVTFYDMTTEKKRRIQTPERGRGYISAHNKSVFFTTKDNNVCICVPKDGKMTSLTLQCYRVLAFNRHSYFLWNNTPNSKRTVLMILSIVNDEPIQHVVQYCDDYSTARRVSDQFFYVSTKGEHRLWFQEEHGAKPYLVHVVHRSEVVSE